MKLSLLRKRYSVVLVSFLLPFSLIGKPAFASPGDSTSAASRASASAASGAPTAISVTASAANSVLTCTNPSTTLTATTTATGGTTFIWSGPDFFSAIGSTVTVSTAGTYTVTATNTAGTGTATISVTSNTAAPAGVTATNNGPLTCNVTNTTITGSTSTSEATLSWAGTGSVANFTASGTSATVTAPGTYILTATNPATGCTTTAPTTVIQTLTVPTGVTASTEGDLTCTNNTVFLNGSSTMALAVTYAWTGPNGFSATGTSATASTAGVYTLTATYTPTGCTASANATVSRIYTAPGNVTATASGPLNCINANVVLTGSSNNSGATYTWAGPNGFTASGITVTATTAGSYTMTAANGSSAFGCTGTATVAVVQDLVVPAGVAAATGGSLTCTNTSVALNGTSSDTAAIFTWSGPASFTASGATVTATTAGTYTLTATDGGSGCSATASTTVMQNIATPVGVTANVANQITCTNPTTTLTGNSTTAGATFAWNGPGSFTSSAGIATASLGGVYTLTVTNSTDGCTTTKTVTVVADTATPTGVTATNSGELNCTITTVTLTGGSTTSGATYIWTGPDGYFDPEQISSMATDSGTYVLTVTNPQNGCSTEASTYVAEDLSACSAIKAQVTAAKASAFNDSTAMTGFTYNVYPNPVSTTTATIEFTVPITTLVNVEVYNSSGIPEQVLFSNSVAANQTYRLTLNPQKLAAGVHYCMIRVNGKVYTSKLLILP